MIPDSVGDAAFTALFGYLFGMCGVLMILLTLVKLFPPKLKGFCLEYPWGIVVAVFMVIYAGGSLALALLITQGYNPLELPTTVRFRIALLTFAILQLPIAALRFTWVRGVGNGVPAPQAFAQPVAVHIANETSGWLEALFFA
ncbi:hypothetical protein HC928_20855 [bacterium]|nr:hypothetical protein [bacterium]